ncbi:hypothetical protein [Brucella pituitosa]|uniref:hypothetical protein n=1 Tax=Brucella pituitosa TaxID=571256 RepID=UPI0013E3EA7B|nr:hypothetical protein [Brucella pituitosa]
MPELDVQPARAVQARAIADTTEKRMIPVHKTQAFYSQTKKVAEMPSTNTRNAPPEQFANQRLPHKAESKVYERLKCNRTKEWGLVRYYEIKTICYISNLIFYIKYTKLQQLNAHKFLGF